MVEYGLLIATVALIVLLGMSAFGTMITPWFSSLAGRLVTLGT